MALRVAAKAVEKADIADSEFLAAGKLAPIRGKLEAADVARPFLHMGHAGVGHVEKAFVGREGEPVRLDEIGRDRFRRAIRRVDAEDMARADLRCRRVALVIGNRCRRSDR